MFFLTPSKLFNALVFSLLGCYIVCQWSLYLSALIKNFLLSFYSLFAVAKVIIYFYLTKCFKRKFKVFLVTLTSFINLNHYRSCSPFNRTAKIRKVLNLATFYF